MANRKQAPWMPAKYEPADASAIQALMRGDANSEQQKRALKWIIECGAGTYDAHYYEDERNTTFALGKAYVGQQVVKLTKLHVPALIKGD